jgi:hypothetical protein
MTVKAGISPMAILGSFRGSVTRARLTYPERAALDVTDAKGGEWRLSTWWSDYSPADPEVLGNKTVVSATLSDPPGKLTVGFSDGTDFTITPVPDEGHDAIENWKLFTPDGLVLTYGPWGRWQLGNATDPC